MTNFPELPEPNLDEIDFEFTSDKPREMLIEVIDAIPDIFRQATWLTFNEVKDQFFARLSEAREDFDELPDAAKELFLERGVNIFIDFVTDDMKEFRLKLKSEIPSNDIIDDMSDDEFESFFDQMAENVQKFMHGWLERFKKKIEDNDFDRSILDPLSAND